MNPVQPSGAVGASLAAPSEDLFSAASYADWVRGAVRLREGGEDVAMLFDSTTAEPTAALVDVVRDAFSERLTSRYVSVFADGNRYAREALARRYGLSVEQFVTATGATGALKMALKAFVRPGDQVLVETPGFDVLPSLAEEAGAEVIPLSRIEPDYRIDMADLERKLTSRTRAVLISNLHNPSGARLPPDDIQALGARLARDGIVLLVDEVYAEYAAATGAPPAVTLGRNIITLSSLTKVFGLFALKFGWLAAHPDLIDQIRTSAPDGDLGVSKLAHAVAAHVLEAPQPFEDHWRRALGGARPHVVRHADALRQRGLIDGEVPEFGCMYFPRIVGVEDTLGLSHALFREHGVLVAPGEYFGAPGRVRIGFGPGGDGVLEGLRRFETGLISLLG